MWGNGERERVRDESGCGGMGGEEWVFGCNGVYRGGWFVVGLS